MREEDALIEEDWKAYDERLKEEIKTLQKNRNSATDTSTSAHGSSPTHKML